ncbi:MAG: hypothetical protein OEM84_02635 [Acidimicrobiia bacterium]|nr:hypothetical protein [Acidimicrobiia bacterium]MDH5615322.1 hypothetical protein [Acidimicrobiia bacterium]
MKTVHEFHIPVMGTGFTIDTPLKVARFGIDSVIQIVDDVLIEQMRQVHSERAGEPYREITDDDDDARANRITAYLNLIHLLVQRQMEVVKGLPFETDTDLTRYFEMLPEGPLKGSYRQMLAAEDDRRAALEAALRRQVVPGSIDVNIMTKLDRDTYLGKRKRPPEFSDALSGLRGFARSNLRSAVVFSAGLNPRLFGYLTEFSDFFPDEYGELRKRIILKVSDYRSAFVQGKYLAKRGLWVSEYRVESGLNCGGHTFPTTGQLMGPILEEFCARRSELIETLHTITNEALIAVGRSSLDRPLPMRITAQGGIGTNNEHRLLLDHFELDATGWATPFLLVPEVTNVDDSHREMLLEAVGDDVELSDASPFGIPFWNLRNSASDLLRRARIAIGKPGSPCPKGYLALHNTEFSEVPICTASRKYVVQKLAHLEEEGYTPEQRAMVEEDVLAKTCLCRDLAGGAELNSGLNDEAATAVCTGPNIVNFSKVATLREMVDHIYGRISLLTNPDRPHMFIREIELYVDYVGKEFRRFALGLSARKESYFSEVKENLRSGVEYYMGLIDRLPTPDRALFEDQLEGLRHAVQQIGALAPV